MENRLKPEIIKTDKSIRGVTGVNVKNTIGVLDDAGDFALLEIDKDGVTVLNTIVPGQPRNKSLVLHSDDENNIMWVIRGRGVYFMDLNSKNASHVIASNDGNGRIFSIFIADPERRIMGITFTNCPGCAKKVLFFDTRNRVKTGELTLGPGMACKYYKSTVLVVYDNKDGTRKWFSCGYSAKGPEDQITDELTRKLTDMQVSADYASMAIHLRRRMMICQGDMAGQRVYFSVRWDEKMEDVKIEPILLQIPRNRYLDSSFSFSKSGEWIKTIAYAEDANDMPPELVVFHSSDIYPQGMSHPILCGYTKETGSGAFMEHELWGACFVDWDSNVPEKLFVYRLVDGLKMLSKNLLHI